MGELAVRLQALDGRWEEVGKDRYPGLVPESLDVQSDPGGFATVSFQLWRPEVWLPSPDLSAATPCEVDEDEARLFEGRVQETPTDRAAGVINVAGRGWQYATDDNAIEPVYVHNRLGAWADIRGRPEVTDAQWPLNGFVEVGAGAIRFGWPDGSEVIANAAVGVTLDLGEENTARALSLDWVKLAGNPALTFIIRAHGGYGGSHLSGAGHQDGGTWGPPLDGSGTVPNGTRYYEWAGPTFYRYVSLFIYNSGGAFTSAAEDGAKLAGVRVFTSLQRSASSGTFFRASDAVLDAFSRRPELNTPTVQEPEEYVDEVLASNPAPYYRFRNANSETDPGGPTGPALVPVGIGGAATPSYDNTPGPLLDGTDSRYVAIFGEYFTTAADEQTEHSFTVVVWVRTAQALGAYTGTNHHSEGAGIVSATVEPGVVDDWALALVQGRAHFGVGNPEQTIRYATNLADSAWHLLVAARDETTGTIRLDVDGVERARLAGTNQGSLDAATELAVAAHLHAPTAGTALIGDLAELAIYPRYMPPALSARLWEAGRSRPRSSIKRTLLNLDHLGATEPRTTRELNDGVNVFHNYRVKVGRDRTPFFSPFPTQAKYAIGPWAAEAYQDAAANSLEDLYNELLLAAPGTDGLAIRLRRRTEDLAEGPTLLDRRGQDRTYRLNIGFPITPAIGTVLADTRLRAMARTPFRGSVPVRPGDLLELPTGQLVHPRNLVLEEGELIHFAGMVDPDTGNLGRDGAIAGVTYSPADEVATVQIDSQRDNFQALLERMAAVMGG